MVGWLFWVERPFETVFQSMSGRLPERGWKRRERIEESKNVQTTPIRTFCKRNRPLSYYHHNCKTGSLPRTIAQPDHPRYVLKSWKEATIIPIPKPGKDNTNSNNHRHIALTSCICETLERMINERLVWYLEKNNIITDFQSGFWHQRSTNDHLVRPEIFIREAFIKKEHLVAVVFDLENAYDTT